MRALIFIVNVLISWNFCHAYYVFLAPESVSHDAETVPLTIAAGNTWHHTVFNSHSGNAVATMAAIRQHYASYGKIIRDSLPKLRMSDGNGYRTEHLLVSLRSAWKNRLILQQLLPFEPKGYLKQQMLNYRHSTISPMTSTSTSTEPEVTNSTTVVIEDTTTEIPSTTLSTTAEKIFNVTMTTEEAVTNATTVPANTTEISSTTTELSTTSTETTLPPIYAAVPIILDPPQYHYQQAELVPLPSMFGRPMQSRAPIRLTRMRRPFPANRRSQVLRDDKVARRSRREIRVSSTSAAATAHPLKRRHQCGEAVQDAACLLLTQYNSGSVFFLPWSWHNLRTNEKKQRFVNQTTVKVSALETVVSLCMGYKMAPSMRCPNLPMLMKLSRISTSFFDQHGEPLYVASLLGEHLCHFDSYDSRPLTPPSNTTADVEPRTSAVLLCGSIIYPSISDASAGSNRASRQLSTSCEEIVRHGRVDHSHANRRTARNRRVPYGGMSTYKCSSFANAINGVEFST